jgi:hypothetical protein
MGDHSHEKAEQIAADLSSYLNGASREDVDYLIDELLRDHRSLIQHKARLFVRFFEKLADKRYDERNEDSVKFARKLFETIPEEERIFRYI